MEILVIVIVYEIVFFVTFASAQNAVFALPVKTSRSTMLFSDSWDETFQPEPGNKWNHGLKCKWFCCTSPTYNVVDFVGGSCDLITAGVADLDAISAASAAANPRSSLSSLASFRENSDHHSTRGIMMTDDRGWHLDRITKIDAHASTSAASVSNGSLQKSGNWWSSCEQ